MRRKSQLELLAIIVIVALIFGGIFAFNHFKSSGKLPFSIGTINDPTFCNSVFCTGKPNPPEVWEYPMCPLQGINNPVIGGYGILEYDYDGRFSNPPGAWSNIWVYTTTGQVGSSYESLYETGYRLKLVDSIYGNVVEYKYTYVDGVHFCRVLNKFKCPDATGTFSRRDESKITTCTQMWGTQLSNCLATGGYYVRECGGDLKPCGRTSTTPTNCCEKSQQSYVSANQYYNITCSDGGYVSYSPEEGAFTVHATTTIPTTTTTIPSPPTPSTPSVDSWILQRLSDLWSWILETIAKIGGK
jgi:hypothetical protein